MSYERVLGVYAHPDDADVGAGGTLARLAAEGAEVSIVVATLGDAGGFEAEGQDNISEVRRQEQIEAAAALGITTVTYLDGYRDGELRVTRELIRDVVAHIRAHRPSLVLSMTPEHNWDSVASSHPDHRAIGEATVQALYPAVGNPFAFRELLAEGLEPWTVGEVWLQGHQHPNFYSEFSAAELDKKVAALRCHASQFQDMEGFIGWIREDAQNTAVAGGVDGPYAEAFLRYFVK